MMDYDLPWNENDLSPMDIEVAPGLRLWMLLGFMAGILTLMVVTVCCFMKIRIPRTKRQIELASARRKLMKKREADAATKAANKDKTHLRLSMSPSRNADSEHTSNGKKKYRHRPDTEDSATDVHRLHPTRTTLTTLGDDVLEMVHMGNTTDNGDLQDRGVVTQVVDKQYDRRRKKEIITDV